MTMSHNPYAYDSSNDEHSTNTERMVPFSSTLVADVRRAMDDDIWLFIKIVCGHGAPDIERHHRPLAYLLAGDADRLAASLVKYKSEIVTQIQSELQRLSIDWTSFEGTRRLPTALSHINNRMSRSTGKTTIELDVVLGLGSRNPDLNIGIVSKSDSAAWSMCDTIGNIMRSDQYKLYYSDRLFVSNPESYITMKWIRMAGRTNPNQQTIEAQGINTQWYSRHFHLIIGDDLSSTEAKQGEATVEDALRFIASLHGISMQKRWGGTRYVFNGTIQGPKDDHAALSSNPTYISTVVPIWKHASGASWNLTNLLDDGIPTIPELASIEDCKEKRADTLATERLGAISWLQNFCLTAHQAGSMQFSAEMLRRSKFVWITRTGLDGIERRYIRRYLWTKDAKGNVVPKLDSRMPSGSPELRQVREQTHSVDSSDRTCRCWMACKDEGIDGSHHAYVEFDPLSLTRVLAVDQAISKTGDRWSVACAAQDPFGYVYALRGSAGHHYRNMIAAIPYVFKRWGGLRNPPRKVGIESNSWQSITVDWLKHDEAFQFLARRLVKLSPGNTQKVLRITNNVLANLEMGLLLLDPDDTDRDEEMLGYNSAIDDPKDDILDSIAMSVTLLGQPDADYDPEASRADEMRAESEYTSGIDMQTGIDVSTNWIEEAMWN